MKFILLLAAAGLQLACQSAVSIHDQRSSAYRVIAVELKQSLVIAADTTRVFIQHGHPIGPVSLSDHYRPQCAFEVSQRLSTPQLVAPARFDIERVQGLVDEVVEARPHQLAGLGFIGMLDDGPPMVHAGYHFWFRPGQPAEALRLSCYGAFADMQEAEPPTLEEIQAALGTLAELRVRPWFADCVQWVASDGVSPSAPKSSRMQ